MAIAAVALAALLPMGCSDNPEDPLIIPPGGRGDIVGTLAFQGVSGETLPIADILAVQTGGTPCTSAFGAIAVMGTFNEFDLGRVEEFLMSQVVPCLWVLETSLDAGTLNMKFVTGNSPTSVAFDNPADYGRTTPNNGDDPLEGEAEAGASFDEGNISVTIPEAGTWTFVLNEATDPPTYRITQESLIIESNDDGSFEINDLPVGTYDVSIEADGFIPNVREDVEVRFREITDLGEVLLEVASGRLSGVVAFSDDPDPRPQATVAVLNAGTAIEIQSATTDSAFVFAGLATGTYDITVNAPGYLTATVEDIAYTNGQDTDIGAITVDPGCVSAFTTIQMAGDFNGFDLGQAPFMTQGPTCVWSDTLLLAQGTYNLKLVTDGAFDNPMDYGGDEMPVNVPGTIPTSLISGIGTAIRIVVLTEANYRFVLDEAALELTVENIDGTAATGSITGTVSFSGISSAPYPAAQIDLFNAGAAEPFFTTSSSRETATFSMTTLPDGEYDVEVSAPCFTTASVAGIVISGGEIDLGAVALDPGSSDHTTIQIAGTVTSWTLSEAPKMTQVSSCLWEADLALEAGTYIFKFVTDGNFDDPLDYGGNESETLTLPGVFDVRFATGEGSAISIEVPAADQYRFRLDERMQQFEVTLVVGKGDGR